MRELAAIKVKIGIKKSGRNAGHHQYPDFGQLLAVRNSGMDWARYVDVHGESWHYDNVSGHRDDDVDSPFGNWDGMLIVPVEFADQAVQMFPDVVSRLTETECGDFYDNRCHVHEPEFHESKDVLQAMAAKRQLEIAETPEDVKALDPDDKTPGIVRNERRRWTDFKGKAGIEFKEKA